MSDPTGAPHMLSRASSHEEGEADRDTSVSVTQTGLLISQAREKTCPRPCGQGPPTVDWKQWSIYLSQGRMGRGTSALEMGQTWGLAL